MSTSTSTTPRTDAPPLHLPPRAAAAMTKRRVQILQLAAEGNTTTQIGAELHLSPHTVNNNLTAIYAVLGARDRAHATSLGIRYGLVNLTRIRSEYDTHTDQEGPR